MSNRRMFSNRIGNSARFLQMPAESQALYFHMILNADDDGIVESYPLMKLLGASPDSFNVLVARGFIRKLNEDQVILISDWLEHNTIRADRKVDSIYHDLLPKGTPRIEAKPRADRPSQPPTARTRELGRPRNNGTEMGRHKLSQVKLSKENTNTATTSVAVKKKETEFNPQGAEIIKGFETVNKACKRYYANKTQRAACDELILAYGLEQVMKVTELLPRTNKISYLPTITTPLQLFEKWAALESGLVRKKQESIEKSFSNNVDIL